MMLESQDDHSFSFLDSTGWGVTKDHGFLTFMHGTGLGFVREDFTIETEEIAVE